MARYDQLIERIKRIDGKNLENFMQLGALIDQIVRLGYGERALCRDANLTRSSAQYWRRAHLYWGDDRIKGCNAFYYHIRAAEINDPTLRQRLITEGIEPHLHRFPRNYRRASGLSELLHKHLDKVHRSLSSNEASLTAREVRALTKELDAIRDAVTKRNTPRAMRVAA